MTAASHLKRKPHARGTTVAYLVRQDAIHQELRRGLDRSKPSLLRKLLGWIVRVFRG
jgi:hypothetical protein